jgi:uncharacterized protein GlcG (DUF336 family)
MTENALQKLIYSAFDAMSTQVPTFQSSPPDWSISEGNVACCIIDEKGIVYGKIWGNDKLKGRKYFDIAYRKASQVWITGYKTGEYEKLVFADKLDYRDFGIELPDLMGWPGGQPIVIDSETIISCGFSGFKGVNDLAIVKNAFDLVVKN